MSVKSPITADPHLKPLVLMDKTIENRQKTRLLSPKYVKPQPLSLSLQLQETREERSIENYSRHTKAWDRHEKQVKLYFEQQDI